MRKVLLLLSILICFHTSVYNQIIRGTVLDQHTKSPIDNALVYFNGTSFGTYADKNGHFELDISKNISMPLTVSALGYNSVNISDFSTGKPVLIQLTPREFELKEVVITGKGNPQARQENLDLFKREFLGVTPNAMNCEITNENDISLIFNSKDETLRAFSSKPIIIDNKALGFKIFYYLNKFEFCKTNNQLFLLGNYIIKEELTSNKIRQQRFERRRETAYLGSRMHFFRTLWENNLDSAGYTIKDSANVRLQYDRIVIQSDSLDNWTPKKYLKYKGRLYITYGKKLVESSILITRENVYFDKMGFFDPTGIQWDGEMAKQLIADLLPFEYSISGKKSIQSSKEDTVEQDTLLPNKKNGQGQFIGSLEEYRKLIQVLPGEKVFLHTDRPNYMQGDTIWFKAYSWYGYDQVPDTLSGVLYVDLLNQKNRAVLSRKLLIQNGTSQGDFTLDTNITSGSYTLHAYTRWMQNLNTGEPFYQTINISPARQYFSVECVPVIIKQIRNDSLKVSFRFFEIDPAGDLKNTYNHKVYYSLKVGDQVLDTGKVQLANTKEKIFKFSLSEIKNFDSTCVFGISINDKRITYEKQFQIPLKEGIDIQFFPEGGKLVNGLVSKVAFKAVGTDGMSREVSGAIETEEGEVVISFESTHKGMGIFHLKPEADKKYFAHTIYDSRNYLIPLPSASAEGSVLSISSSLTDSDSYITIKRTHSDIIAKKYVIGSAYGKIWFSALVKTASDSCRFKIPMDLLPEGVCRLTVLNDDFKPESERLIYVDKNTRFKIEVIPDSSSYATRSKVTLLLKTTDADGEPVKADLSLSVFDKAQIVQDAVPDGITAYKLLKSELRGNIEEPDFYFNNDSVINRDKLDLLMLTQGYRNFIPDSTDIEKHKFQPETNFEVSGKVKLSGSKLREKKFKYTEVGLTIFCWSTEVYMGQCNPDSLGRFRFTLPLLFGKTHSLIQATNSRKKPLYGNISLNEIIVDRPKFVMPSNVSYNLTSPAIETVRQSQANLKTIISKDPAFGAMTGTLGEVIVTAKAKNWYLDFEHNAKKIVDLDSLDPTGNKFETINDLLVREFGAQKQIFPGGIKTVYLPCVSFDLDYWFPIYLVNGSVVFDGSKGGAEFMAWLNHISFLHVNEIKKIMVLPPGNIPSHYADAMLRMEIRQSLVVIETYSDFSYRGDPQGIKTFILDGLNTPRSFYSPRYEGSSKGISLYDGRATLYWGPSIKTDSLGQAKVEFYTTDRQTVLDVIVNGMELVSGAPGQSKSLINYTLKK